MAGVKCFGRLLERHKATIVRDLDVTKLLPSLVQKGVFTLDEERLILSEKTHVKRSETFVDLLAAKGFKAFQEFCLTLELVSPHLLTNFLLDNAASSMEFAGEEKSSTHALQLGFQLALRERDAVLRENAAAVKERDAALQKYQAMKSERDRALASLDSLASKGSHQPPSAVALNSREEDSDLQGTPWPSPSRRSWSRGGMGSEDSSNLGGERVVWEYHTVTLTRVPGYGFGIAVSGGRDNPHFGNGDPAIAISDVLKAGPAEGKLQINDRVMSANGVPLENVDYATAVQVLRDSGATVNLVIKRRVVLPSSEPHTLRITLTKNKKKDDFGIILGCRIYVKEVTNKNLMEKAGGLQEGDIIAKINSAPTDTMTLKEAKKLMENCKEKLQLVIRREPSRTSVDNLQRVPSQNLYESTISPNAKYETNSHPNFIDISDTRPYSNQNLYVQPPTRSENYRSPPPPPDPRNIHDDKNNLIRMTSRNRGPLLDISLSQLDQPATPLLHGHGHNRVSAGATNEDEEPPPRPPLPRVEDGSAQPSTPSRDPVSHSSDFYNSRRDLYDEDPLARRNKQFLPDPRYISFQKDGSVGIRLTGGNDVGIFVTAVQPGSPASLQGLQPGDKILKVNNMDMKDVTREEAVLYLLSLQDRIDLIVQYRKDEYDAIAANQRGDSFYIRTHFNYDNNSKGEMSFRVGDIFRVVDTLHNGVVGSWQVYRIGRNNQETQKGIIPNKNRAEELATEQQNLSKKDSSSENRGSFFKRRSARRSKSLSKEQWDDVVLSDSMSKYPAYERVSLRHPGFTRPVILFGPLSDYAREKLLKDYPEKFASPQLDSQMEETPKSSKSSCIVRLSAIKEIIDRGKHAVIDITPNAVDRLNYAQFYPIVIFMRADNKHVIKELRGRSTKSSGKSSKKLFDHAVKLEKNWSHIFTATITLTSADTWYKKIRESIEKQQQQAIWMSETKPEEPITDDFLFPMTSRLSYASSPESDLDLAVDSHHRGLFDTDASLFGERRLVKASSDPSIATQEEVGLPSYHGPPPYSASPYQRQPLQYTSLKKNFEDRLYEDQIGDTPKRHNDETRPDERHFSQLSSVDENRNERNDYISQGRSKADPYGATSLNDNYGGRMNGDIPEMYNSKGWSSVDLEAPPKVDRANKPAHLRTAQERLFGGNQYRGRLEGGDSDLGTSGNYINTNKTMSIDRNDIKQYTMQMQGGYESSSYSSDSYNKFPNSVQDEMKLKDRYNQQMMQNRSLHDPYRFTRSTAQPIKALANEKPKPNDLPSKYRSDYKPVPPPKSPNYKPVPPPKPKNYRSPTSTGHPMDSYWTRDDVPPPPPLGKQSEGHNMMNHHGRNGDYPRHSSSSTAHYMKSYSSSEPNQHFNSMNNPGDHYPHDRYNNLKGKFDDDSGGFDSGQGSSLDRNYDGQAYISKQVSPSSRGYYYNVPPPRDLNFHTREPSGLDLSNRENRGSAFELYKKPDSRSPPGLSPLTVNIDSLKTESSSSSSTSPKDTAHEDEKTERIEIINLENGDINLDNHTVIAMASGKFNHEGGVLASEETGVSIVIPQGALAEGEEQEIYFKVCQDKKMLPPLDKAKGETLLSPLVMCGPHGLKFAVPVELHLPHCASVNPDSWSFALKSSDTPSGIPTQWQNVSLSNLAKESQSRVDVNSVSILIDHF